ncbi:MAG TPA: urea ABC transporter permease subunit UrtB, partial [Cellvibrionaceae bacterium]
MFAFSRLEFWYRLRQICLLLPLLLLAPLLLAEDNSEAEATPPPDFEQLVADLTTGSLSKRADTVMAIANTNDDRVITILTALSEGNLEASRDTPPVIAIKIQDNNFLDALTGESLTNEMTEDLRRVPINNRLRGQLRTLLSQLNLNNNDAQIRYNAVRRFIRDGVDSESIAMLQERQQLERTAIVNNAIDTAMALYRLQSDQAEIRLAAIDTLRGSLESEARIALAQLAEEDPDTEVREHAQQALDSISSRISFYRFIENLFFGLSLGSVLLLAAIGLAITFGVMGVINMAHGELIMIGAYTTWMVQQLFPNLIEWSLL